MKKEYNTPELELVVLESEDILSVSGGIDREYDPDGAANDTGAWNW